MKRKRRTKSKTENANTQKPVLTSALDLNRSSFDTMARWGFARQERIGQTIDTMDRAQTSAKSRYEYLNNDHFCGIVRAFAVSVIGTGPRLVFNVDHLIPDRKDETLNRKARNICGEVERKFHNWINGFGYFSEQYAGMISMILDGEMLGVWNYNPNTKVCPFVYRSIDVSRLINPNNAPDSAYMHGGIIYDTWGDPEYYCILDLPANPNYSYDYGKYQTVPANRINHIYIPEFAEQTRGISMAAQSLQRIGRLRDFEEATLEGAKNAASIVGVITTELGYGGPSSVRDAFQSQSWDNEAVPMNRNTWLKMPPKAKADIFPSQPTNVDHNSYVNNSLTALAHPFGMPKNQATNTSDDYNFSSAKLDLLNSMRFVDFVRKQLNHKMNDKSFRIFWDHQRPKFLEQYAHEEIEYIPEIDDCDIKWRYPLPPEIEPWRREEMFKTMLETKTASKKDILELRGSDITWFDLEDQLATEATYHSDMTPALQHQTDDTGVATADTTVDVVQSKPDESLQSTALNGAQVTAAVDIIVKVTTGELPAQTAIKMLMEFFQLSETAAMQMIQPAEQHTPVQPIHESR